jgi:hypothetical protein
MPHAGCISKPKAFPAEFSIAFAIRDFVLSLVLQRPWALGFLIFSFMIIQTVGRLGWVISTSQGLYINTRQHKHRINTHIPNTHVLCGIRTNDHGFRTSKDSTCLRPPGYRDRGYSWLPTYKQYIKNINRSGRKTNYYRVDIVTE